MAKKPSIPTPAPGTRARTPAAEVEVKPRAQSGAVHSFDTALAYLHDRVDLERLRQTRATRDEYKLDRMRAILTALDNPQDAVRMVHVAGTKGKGSTCEMIATALEHCGYAVGLYTSPHLVDIRERIRLNRQNIPEADFVALTQRVGKAADAVHATHGEATFFELLTAMGFQYFADQAVDVAVIEVGLGGLLDCTNVITPEVCAVTTIGFDHMEILGDTLEAIAAQKAGIFKPGVPALVIQQPAPILKVFRDKAAEVGATCEVVGEDVEFSYRFEWQAGTGPTARVSLTTERSVYDHVAAPLKGEHQALNCGLALAVLDKLSERGFSCPEAKVVKGLGATSLPGRFELAVNSPRVLLDGAHNPESMRALVKAIGAYMQYDSLVVVFGIANDKDVDNTLKALAAGADKVIFTQATGNSRAMKPAELQRRYNDLSGKMSQVADRFGDAFDLALRAVGRGDLICVTGSFYLVGEAKKLIAQKIAAKTARK